MMNEDETPKLHHLIIIIIIIAFFIIRVNHDKNAIPTTITFSTSDRLATTQE
jgi:hypothetical protein